MYERVSTNAAAQQHTYRLVGYAVNRTFVRATGTPQFVTLQAVPAARPPDARHPAQEHALHTAQARPGPRALHIAHETVPPHVIAPQGLPGVQVGMAARAELAEAVLGCIKRYDLGRTSIGWPWAALVR
jgi:hypothetical protein